MTENSMALQSYDRSASFLVNENSRLCREFKRALAM
jgi:hypothetical protein